jgi:uncharacterized protein (TIGR03790 family)
VLGSLNYMHWEQSYTFLGRTLMKTLVALLLWLCLSCWTTTNLLAGGGPENLLLVVNPRSSDSLTLANHYIELRKIPPSHVVYVAVDPTNLTMDINTFRTLVLQQIFQSMQSRGILEQIDFVVYSAGFPTSIDLRADIPAGVNMGPVPAIGSITGLTHLYVSVLQKNGPHFLGNNSNYYYRAVTAAGQAQPTRAFHGWYGWNSTGQVLESGGMRYLPTMMLSTITNGGNTLDESLANLKTSINADGQQPSGTFYFSDHGDVRAKTRAGQFEWAVAELNKLRRPAKIIAERFPSGKQDINGAMLGFSGAGDVTNDVQLLPGAIVENLTSFGAKFGSGHGQPLLSAYLKLGAVGSCGTVDEPLANPAKFPHASLFVHYARGCNLAESFYQSVAAPWQLLMVGDPLCAPWASFPTLQPPPELAKVSSLFGKVKFTPQTNFHPSEIDRYELFVDGARVARCKSGDPIELDTTKFSDGKHDLRLVAITATDIEVQGRILTVLPFRNYGRDLDLQVDALAVRPRDELLIKANSENAKAIILYANGRILHRTIGTSLKVSFKPEDGFNSLQFGKGPVTFRAIAMGEEGIPSHVVSQPVTVDFR